MNLPEAFQDATLGRANLYRDMDWGAAANALARRFFDQ
jgi:hypothetical protein